jgi:hypothetical protein
MPWADAIDEFPLAGTPAEKLRAAARLATRAPSSHNSQPWIFRIEGTTVSLFADRSRALPVVDPEDRELIISCGAALYLLRLSLACFGHQSMTRLWPDPGDPDLVARVTLGAAALCDERTHRLFQAALVRRTNRNAFTPADIPELILERAALAATAEEASLDAFTDPGRKARLADLIADADRIQMADPAFRRELAAWIHPNRSRSRDGMPGYALRMGGMKSEVLPRLIRTFDIGKGQAAADRDLALGSPALALLWTDDDSPTDWVHAGQGLLAALLTLQDSGISASFLNQPIEVTPLRRRLARVCGCPGTPQLILRLGMAPETFPTPRRDPHDVIVAATP